MRSLRIQSALIPRLAVALATGLAGLVTGCAPTLRGPAARPDEGFAAHGGLAGPNGPTAAVVFEHETVTRFHAGIPPEQRAETSRRDISLGMGPRPVPLDTGIRSARRTTLSRTARDLILN